MYLFILFKPAASATTCNKRQFHNQTSHRQVHQARTHVYTITATYQINNLTQTSREGSNSTKHERRPTEDGQTIVTETCRVLIDVFYKHF